MSAGRFEGTTLEAALDAASGGLGCRHDELAYRVLEEEPGRFLVEAWVDPLAVLGLFLVRTLGAGGLDIRTELSAGPELLAGELKGDDVGILLGGRGEALDALQYLCNRVLDGRLGEHPAVRLDSGGFKARRREQLERTARREAERAVRGGRLVRLDPMTPAARREIHLALADDPRVETDSHGSGFFKRVVICPRRR